MPEQEFLSHKEEYHSLFLMCGRGMNALNSQSLLTA